MTTLGEIAAAKMAELRERCTDATLQRSPPAPAQSPHDVPSYTAPERQHAHIAELVRSLEEAPSNFRDLIHPFLDLPAVASVIASATQIALGLGPKLSKFTFICEVFPPEPLACIDSTLQ